MPPPVVSPQSHRRLPQHAVDMTMWRSRVSNGIGDCYRAKMAKKPPQRQRKTSTAGPFFDLLDQMEALTTTVDLDWLEDIRADAQRRLNRLSRALRHAPETRELRLFRPPPTPQ
jgi:hypothetical protein